MEAKTVQNALSNMPQAGPCPVSNIWQPCSNSWKTCDIKNTFLVWCPVNGSRFKELRGHQQNPGSLQDLSSGAETTWVDWHPPVELDTFT